MVKKGEAWRILFFAIFAKNFSRRARFLSEGWVFLRKIFARVGNDSRADFYFPFIFPFPSSILYIYILYIRKSDQQSRGCAGSTHDFSGRARPKPACGEQFCGQNFQKLPFWKMTKNDQKWGPQSAEPRHRLSFWPRRLLSFAKRRPCLSSWYFKRGSAGDFGQNGHLEAYGNQFLTGPGQNGHFWSFSKMVC